MTAGLKELRKGAGFRAAHDFAETIGIPPTTYARYEQAPLRIPTRALVKLADWFESPVDAVLGREMGPAVLRGPQQAVYDMLSPRGRAEVDKFMAYQMYLDGRSGQ